MRCLPASIRISPRAMAGVMVKTGLTYGNLRVNVRPTNAKLVDRAQRIVMDAAGCDRATAEQVLEAARMDVKTAIVMQCLGLKRAEAEAKLAAAKGVLRAALG